MRFERQRGIAMFVALSVILILLFLGASLIYFMTQEFRLTGNYVDATNALFLAEAGVEQAFYEMKSELDPGGVNDYGWKEHIIDGASGSRSIETLTEFRNKIQSNVPGGDIKDVAVTFNLIPDEDDEHIMTGLATVKSIGEYRGSRRGVEVTRFVKVFLGPGKLVPGYGYTLFVKTGEYLDHYGIDSDFIVKGEKVYMDSTCIELGDELIDELCTFWDLGYGIWGGGVDLTGVTGALEGEIFRRYYKYDPKEVLGIPMIPWWREIGKQEEEYNEKVIPTKITEISNLYSAEDYKRYATEVCEYDECRQNVQYEAFSIMGHDFRKTRYNSVKKFYGYADDHDVPKWWKFWENPTKADATTEKDCIQLNGVTFCDGDVYIEGFYTGYGAIVATGNIYVGGDLMKWGGSDEVRDSSALSLIALGNNGKDGKVIVKPHHDKDWARYTLYSRDLTPYVEANIYSNGGIQQDEESVFSGFINYTQKGGMVVEGLDRKKMTTDVLIEEDKAANELHENYNGKGPIETVITHFDEDILAWRQVSTNIIPLQ